jgi:hypothetical protein
VFPAASAAVQVTRDLASASKADSSVKKIDSAKAADETNDKVIRMDFNILTPSKIKNPGQCANPCNSPEGFRPAQYSMLI